MEITRQNNQIRTSVDVSVENDHTLPFELNTSIQDLRASQEQLAPVAAIELQKSFKSAFSQTSEPSQRALQPQKSTISVQVNFEPKPVVIEKPPEVKQVQSSETQTFRGHFQPIQLSPFDTYDLYFVKDLVNKLSQDNEVLQDSNQDLKYSFAFLL